MNPQFAFMLKSTAFEREGLLQCECLSHNLLSAHLESRWIHLPYGYVTKTNHISIILLGLQTPIGPQLSHFSWNGVTSHGALFVLVCIEREVTLSSRCTCSGLIKCLKEKKKNNFISVEEINRKFISGTLTPCSIVSWSEKLVDWYNKRKNNKSINRNSWIHSLSISLLPFFSHSRVVYQQRRDWTRGWITKVWASCITATFNSQSSAFDFMKYRYPAVFGKPREQFISELRGMTSR